MARAWKPWFVYRPEQLWHRLTAVSATATFAPVRTAWGATLLARPSRDIGRSILTTGIFDLAVSEAIARLVPPGGTMIDAGANIGYMSVLAATVAGPRGTVLAFEPHPELAGILRHNVGRLEARASQAPVMVHATALGSHAGTASLWVPDAFGDNDGIAHVVDDAHEEQRADRAGEAGKAVKAGAAGQAIDVPVITLDDVLGSRHADLLKIDVEGYEAHVLAGAQRSLNAHRIRHIVFEDHDAARSVVIHRLREAGYTIFALGWTMYRLRLERFAGRSAAQPYEAPNFIATVDPEALQAACAARGWRTLRRLSSTVDRPREQTVAE